MSTNFARTFDFADFENGPLCLNCGEPTDHGVVLGEEVPMRRSRLTALRLQQGLLDRLTAYAVSHDMSVSAVIRTALRRFLE